MGEIPTGAERVAALLREGTDGLPVAIETLREEALARLDDDVAAYLEAGAGRGRTVDNNRRGFAHYRLVPRVLRDVRERTHETTLLGARLPAPVGLAPVGFQRMFHPDAERATARAAAALGIPLGVSSFASTTLEAVADELDGAPGWFQLYASHDETITANFIERAEAAGYDAIVVTVDAHGFGWREAVLDHAGIPVGPDDEPANYYADPAFVAGLDESVEVDPDAARARYEAIAGPAVVDRDDLKRIVAATDLPVIVKGVMHPDDAAAAVDAGAAGVVVSNHGGRMVDNALAAIDALSDVADRVGDRAVVAFDSGVRRGADALVALALGADIVMLGRPYVYGLALAGEAGVDAVMRNFLADLDMTLALTGYSDLNAVDTTAIRRT